MLTLRKIAGRAAAAGLALAAYAQAASAQTRNVGGIAQDLTGQITNISSLVTVVSFVLGVGLAIMGLMKFKAYSDNKNDPSNKLSTAFMLVFVGAGLVAIPAVLGSGIQTIFGTGADTTDATSGFTSLN